MMRSGIYLCRSASYFAHMRIIAGEFRGRKLLPPQGEATRPITDRVKQSLFDILAPRLPGARVYDCFAGTGSMGLEALSRGAEHVTFFEADRSAHARLRRNIDTIGSGAKATVVSGDLFRWFDSARPPERADFIFLDPPYRFLAEQPAKLQRLVAEMDEHHMADQCVIIFRHGAGDSLDLPAVRLADRREYGSMVIELLMRANAPGES